VLSVDAVPQATNNMMIAKDIIDTCFEIFICKSMSTSQILR
jgi:hypothetical protein